MAVLDKYEDVELCSLTEKSANYFDIFICIKKSADYFSSLRFLNYKLLSFMEEIRQSIINVVSYISPPVSFAGSNKPVEIAL